MNVACAEEKARCSNADATTSQRGTAIATAMCLTNVGCAEAMASLKANVIVTATCWMRLASAEAHARPTTTTTGCATTSKCWAVWT